MTPIKKIMDNKIISGIVIAIFGSLIALGTYVTLGAIKSHNSVDLSPKVQILTQKQEIIQTVIENVRGDIVELKKDTKEIRVELKEQREIIYKNQEKILERLGSINKGVGSVRKSMEMNFEKESKEPVMLEKEK